MKEADVDRSTADKRAGVNVAFTNKKQETKATRAELQTENRDAEPTLNWDHPNGVQLFEGVIIGESPCVKLSDELAHLRESLEHYGDQPEEPLTSEAG